LLKKHKEAETAYQKALALLLANKSLEPDEARKLSASIYHQLGRVAQEQRQWAQAEQYYQKALEIYVEFNDRYQQAGTYHQLGVVAEEQRQWAQAEQYPEGLGNQDRVQRPLLAGQHLPPVGRGGRGTAAVGAG